MIKREIKVIITHKCHAVLIMSFKNCLKLSDPTPEARFEAFILASQQCQDSFWAHEISAIITLPGTLLTKGATVFMIVNPVNSQLFSSLSSYHCSSD